MDELEFLQRLHLAIYKKPLPISTAHHWSHHQLLLSCEEHHKPAQIPSATQ